MTINIIYTNKKSTMETRILQLEPIGQMKSSNSDLDDSEIEDGEGIIDSDQAEEYELDEPEFDPEVSLVLEQSLIGSDEEK